MFKKLHEYVYLAQVKDSLDSLLVSAALCDIDI